MSKEKYIVGIDIGLSGGIFITGNSKLAMHKMPIKNGELDTMTLFRMLNYFKPNNVHVCFEKIQKGGLFGTGKVQAWSLAKQISALETILKILKLPYTEVRPKTWQKEMFAGIEMKKRAGKGGKDKTEFVNDTKAAAYFSYLHHYPKLEVPKGSRGAILDGIIDAALIARYCERILKKK